MSLEKKILKFPLERIKISPSKIMETSLRNKTFYKSGEVDAIVDEKGLTYGEWKEKLAHIYLSFSGSVPDDILFLLSSKKELEDKFLDNIKSKYGFSSNKYKYFKQVFLEIHNNRY